MPSRTILNNFNLNQMSFEAHGTWCETFFFGNVQFYKYVKQKRKVGGLLFPKTVKHVKHRSCIIGHSATCLHVPELSVKVSENNQRWAGMKTVFWGFFACIHPTLGSKWGQCHAWPSQRGTLTWGNKHVWSLPSLHRRRCVCASVRPWSCTFLQPWKRLTLENGQSIFPPACSH